MAGNWVYFTPKSDGPLLMVGRGWLCRSLLQLVRSGLQSSRNWCLIHQGHVTFFFMDVVSPIQNEDFLKSSPPVRNFQISKRSIHCWSCVFLGKLAWQWKNQPIEDSYLLLKLVFFGPHLAMFFKLDETAGVKRSFITHWSFVWDDRFSPTSPLRTPLRNKGLIRPYQGKPTVNQRLTRPCF